MNQPEMNTGDPVAGQASYSEVRILKPGVFNAGDGMTVSLDGDQLEQIAANFDPGYLLPTLNLDHNDSGPALGRVDALYYDGEFLRANISGVPPGLAQQIDDGAYPSRSAEIYLDFEGRGPALRAVALLGAQPPAVKGLGPMQRATQQQSPAGFAAGRWRTPVNPEPFSVTLFSEVPMGNSEQKTAADPVLLAEENQRLQAENHRLKLAEQQRETAVFLDELRAAGKLTPALEQAGIEQLLLAVCEQPVVVKLAEGGQAELPEMLKRIFSALPSSFSCTETDFSDEDREPVALSEEERHVAAQLGLTSQEYSEIRRLNT